MGGSKIHFGKFSQTYPKVMFWSICSSIFNTNDIVALFIIFSYICLKMAFWFSRGEIFNTNGTEELFTTFSHIYPKLVFYCIYSVIFMASGIGALRNFLYIYQKMESCAYVIQFLWQLESGNCLQLYRTYTQKWCFWASIVKFSLWIILEKIFKFLAQKLESGVLGH